MEKCLNFLLVLVGISICGMPVQAFAQKDNPLRVLRATPTKIAPETVGTFEQVPKQPTPDSSVEMPADVYEAVYGNKQAVASAPATQIPQVQSIPEQAQAPIIDSQVAPTVHVTEAYPNQKTPQQTINAGDLEGINQMLGALQAKHSEEPAAYEVVDDELDLIEEGSNFPIQQKHERRIQPAPSDRQSPTAPSMLKGANQEKFQKLLQKIAINTCIVMCMGVGFILIAKQWFFKGSKPVKKPTEAPIQITSTLRLGHKANLFLVQAGSHRLIVASDQNGINSVVPLTDTFATTLDSLAADSSQDTDAEKESETMAGGYSLATVGKLKTDKVNQSKPRETEVEEQVRKKMEAALSDHGLKELFLQSLRSQD